MMAAFVANCTFIYVPFLNSAGAHMADSRHTQNQLHLRFRTKRLDRALNTATQPYYETYLLWCSRAMHKLYG